MTLLPFGNLFRHIFNPIDQTMKIRRYIIYLLMLLALAGCTQKPEGINPPDDKKDNPDKEGTTPQRPTDLHRQPRPYPFEENK